MAAGEVVAPLADAGHQSFERLGEGRHSFILQLSSDGSQVDAQPGQEIERALLEAFTRLSLAAGCAEEAIIGKIDDMLEDVVEELVEYGRDLNLGLEAGSKLSLRLPAKFIRIYRGAAARPGES